MKSSALAAILAAVGVSALIPAHRLQPRQSSNSTSPSSATDEIPAACTAKCRNTVQYAELCGDGGEVASCEEACKQPVFNEYMECLQCITTNTPEWDSSYDGFIQIAVDQLKQECASAGHTLTGQYSYVQHPSAILAIPNFTSTPTGNVTLPEPTTRGNGNVTLGSATTIPLTSTNSASGGSSQVSGATSAASAPAASGSGNDSSATPVTGVVGGLVALVSVGVGMLVLA
ncbi:uncharacterized protein I303_100451 [Kwoniella dejecticola CBS 10117]|uniref:Extracellular membrane protein CFEM domain-containing protein n=1 Tax=Kwoniella dejecticola CBS 10117 TaxID=1296121 RepID=A0A1A6AF08_9TREE|nr:uncharacterized protein I303_00451 [Kwoniella dejecticola CBS 10117]OBR88634.1 hypothetical protein I303_00451 [Kwoniella dejecticola CBS 10117]